MKYAIHTRRLLSLAIAASCLGAPLALAQRGAREEPPRTPATHLADGTVDLGGKGIWSLPWVTDFAVRMPGYKKGDQPPMLPWTQAMWDYNKANSVKYDPEGFCLPPGGPRSMGTPYPVQFIRENDRMVLIFEGGGHVWREIHMDGREHPKDINPTYFGDSIGHWEGDTLVVDTIGFNEKFWLTREGIPLTEHLHLTERFTRTDYNTLKYEATLDDPGAYSKPWTGGWLINWQPNEELYEYVCQDNNRDVKHMYGGPREGGTPNVGSINR
jgi:hypothetical protein